MVHWRTNPRYLPQELTVLALDMFLQTIFALKAGRAKLAFERVTLILVIVFSTMLRHFSWPAALKHATSEATDYSFLLVLDLQVSFEVIPSGCFVAARIMWTLQMFLT